MHKLAVILLLVIITVACQDLAELPERGNYERIPVIEAVITDQLNYQRVRVSYSTQLNDSLSSIPVSDAQVKIVTEHGDTVSFKYTGNGYYINNDFISSSGELYELQVQINTIVYRATSMMVPVNGLDSVTYSHGKKHNNRDSAYYLKFFAGETDREIVKYYKIQIYKNGRLVTTGSNTVLFSDKSTSSLNGIELDHGFARADTLDIELYSLSKEVFYYYVYAFNNILYNANFDLDFKTNPAIQFSPKALGYFQVSSLSRKRVIIR